MSCHILTILIKAANNKEEEENFIYYSRFPRSAELTEHWSSCLCSLRHLLGQPALSLRSLSHHPSTSQWLSNQPRPNTITKGDITQWHSTYYISRSIATGEKATFQNFDSIIFIYFISLKKTSNIENNYFLHCRLKSSWDDILVIILKISKCSPVNKAILLNMSYIYD